MDDAGRRAVAARLALTAGSVNRRLRPRGDDLGHIAVSALASIARLGPVRPGDLARVEGVGAPGVARLLADLEQRGLIERSPDPDDGRAHRVALSADGFSALETARARRTAGVLDLLAGASDADIARIAAALDVLDAALAARTPEPRPNPGDAGRRRVETSV